MEEWRQTKNEAKNKSLGQLKQAQQHGCVNEGQNTGTKTPDGVVSCPSADDETNSYKLSELGTADAVAATGLTSRQSQPSGESPSSAVPSAHRSERERERERESSSVTGHRCPRIQTRSSEVNLTGLRSSGAAKVLALAAVCSCSLGFRVHQLAVGFGPCRLPLCQRLRLFQRPEFCQNLTGALFPIPYYEDSPVVVLVLSFSIPSSHFPLWLVSCSFIFFRSYWVIRY
ncbi:hypothetical protein Cgig2_005137 [Carnegiea gigantea]|uniref:Uncharacterized protein n=1 Tax=Carnegiea gigantea TaxID=171969 RepID=A0A9Q1QHC2_9CARY|nr:hypothetical protein Cgig2_005137 [Carnegiea gigantea]